MGNLHQTQRVLQFNIANTLKHHKYAYAQTRMCYVRFILKFNWQNDQLVNDLNLTTNVISNYQNIANQNQRYYKPAENVLFLCSCTTN